LPEKKADRKDRAAAEATEEVAVTAEEEIEEDVVVVATAEGEIETDN
jgi:hypothetical protein